MLPTVSSCFAHEGCLELVESFDQTVGTGMVGSGSGMADSKELH